MLNDPLLNSSKKEKAKKRTDAQGQPWGACLSK
jgi:hypothetical protein